MHKSCSQIYKVPATDVEALKSPLMGLFEKRRARKFFIYVQDYEENDPKSHEGMDLNKVTARDLISYTSHPYFFFSLTAQLTQAHVRNCTDCYFSEKSWKFALSSFTLSPFSSSSIVHIIIPTTVKKWKHQLMDLLCRSHTKILHGCRNFNHLICSLFVCLFVFPDCSLYCSNQLNNFDWNPIVEIMKSRIFLLHVAY